MTIVNEVMKVVVLHDCLRDGRHRDAHVCVVFGLHWCAQIKVLEVTHHAACTCCGEDTVEEELGGHDISCFGADVPEVLNAVATHGPSHAVRVGFFGLVGTDDA